MAMKTTSVGSLTTTYTPIWTGDCNSIFSASNPNGGWLQHGQPGTAAQSSCLPSGWADTVVPYWSPGICPSGFTVDIYTVYKETSTGICCPINYSVRTTVSPSDRNICMSSISSTWLSTIMYTFYGTQEGPDTPSPVVHSFQTTEFVGGKGVIIQRQETDSTWDLGSPSSLPSPSATTNSAGSGGGEGGLSTGAKAGIGVGVSLGVILILAVIFAAYKIGRGRRREQQEQYYYQQQQQQSLSPPTSWNATTSSSDAAKSGGGGSSHPQGWTQQTQAAYQPPPIHEVSGHSTSSPTELPSQHHNYPPEMEGGGNLK